MNTDGLRTFLLVSKLKNFTRVAEQLFIAQSTVTNRIAELEKELSAKLLRRDTRNVALTEQGRAYARRILQPIYNAEEQAMARTLEQFSPDFLLAVEALTEQLCRSFQENILNLDRKEP